MSTFANFHDEREDGFSSKDDKYYRWDYITLSDFRSSSCGKLFSYLWLWILAFIAIAVAAADTYTAIALLVLGKWSSQIEPAIPIRISKWIFVACISFSWLLYLYSWQRAIRIIRRRNVVESYLDPLAVTLQSIRDGQGWRRFLVFAALTKSKKGADYVALFTYFQFQGAVRILLAEGPRQAVNAITLYTVMRAKLIPVGANAASDGHSPIIQFFVNVKILADEHTMQAVILFSMLFTLIIWVISALALLISCILWLTFLFHYIPSEDGTLSRYCRRKIDKRLEKIVGAKIQKALQKQANARRKAEEKAAMPEKPLAMADFSADTKTKAHDVTVKDLGVLDLPLSRRTTGTSTTTMSTTQPAYRQTRQERLAQQQPSMDSISEFTRPGAPTRTATQTSQATSADGDARPLLREAASMGRIVPVRTISNQSSQSYEKSLPVPGGYDDDYSSLYSRQQYTLPMDTFNLQPLNMPVYELPTRPGSAQSNRRGTAAARPWPSRMPSNADYAAGPAYDFNRQPSYSSQGPAAYGSSAPSYNMQHMPSLYPQRTNIEHPQPVYANTAQPYQAFDASRYHPDLERAQPHYTNTSHTYQPYYSTQPQPPIAQDTLLDQDPPYTNGPLHSRTPSPQPSPPVRASTFTAPRKPLPTFTPPKRAGTAPPPAAATSRDVLMTRAPSSSSSLMERDEVYELDSGSDNGTERNLGR